MPSKITFEKVKETFEKNQCILIDTEYKNNVTPLNFIASCGHERSISFKRFQLGSGIKCISCALELLNYDKVKDVFMNKGCTILMTEQEFKEQYKNNHIKINYIASCGHENKVTYKNFNSLNQGINCPSCVNVNTGIKLKALRSGDKNNSSLEQEYHCIQYFTKLLKNDFTIRKTFDGCKSDIVLKPIDIKEDLWLGIQVKTTHEKTAREQYYFRLNNGKYENCLILCICEEDKSMWMIPYEDVKDFKTIGVAKKSKYNKYQVNNENIKEILYGFYESMQKFSFSDLNIPISKNQQQEKLYRELREQKIDFITFTNHELEGKVYDFKIGDYKIQEKVGTIMHDNINSYMFQLTKNNGRVDGKCVSCCYEKGDNDFYWLNCKNGKFYVFPEDVLLEEGYIGTHATKPKLFLSSTNPNKIWSNDYLFDYNNLDKKKLQNLFQCD